MYEQSLTIYWCDFCGSKFATFARFPDDIMPYCVNCACDDEITELDTIDLPA